MKLKDLPEYCKSKDKCDDCEYTCACDNYLDGYINPLLPFYGHIHWDAEIRKDNENDL